MFVGVGLAVEARGKPAGRCWAVAEVVEDAVFVTVGLTLEAVEDAGFVRVVFAPVPGAQQKLPEVCRAAAVPWFFDATRGTGDELAVLVG